MIALFDKRPTPFLENSMALKEFKYKKFYSKQMRSFTKHVKTRPLKSGRPKGQRQGGGRTAVCFFDFACRELRYTVLCFERANCS